MADSLLDAVPISRRTMVLFFMIDTSGSMSGTKIGSVNTAIEEAIPEIRDIAESNGDAQIKIAALQFDSGCRWITSSGPIESEKFRWNYMDASGVTDFGAACKELENKLHTKEFMKDSSSYQPAIILLSDGEPTDNWQPELDKLKQNNWFSHAIKVAIAVGYDANSAVLEQFTGTSEAVLEVHNTAALKRMIKLVSRIVSKEGSQGGGSKNLDGTEITKQDRVNERLKEEASTDSSDVEW